MILKRSELADPSQSARPRAAPNCLLYLSMFFGKIFNGRETPWIGLERELTCRARAFQLRWKRTPSLVFPLMAPNQWLQGHSARQRRRQMAGTAYLNAHSIHLADPKADPKWPQVISSMYTFLKWGMEGQGKFYVEKNFLQPGMRSAPREHAARSCLVEESRGSQTRLSVCPSSQGEKSYPGTKYLLVWEVSWGFLVVFHSGDTK